MKAKRLYIRAPLLAAAIAVLPAIAQNRSPVAPREEQVKAIVNEAYTMFKGDTSGKNADYVGLPAKSGVGGGILAVVPGKGGIAVFAPPLDEAGNSVKAQKVISYVAQELEYNLFSPAFVGLTTSQ